MKKPQVNPEIICETEQKACEPLQGTAPLIAAEISDDYLRQARSAWDLSLDRTIQESRNLISSTIRKTQYYSKPIGVGAYAGQQATESLGNFTVHEYVHVSSK
jgi:hypothetical protein